jgi:universal stress protein A
MTNKSIAEEMAKSNESNGKSNATGQARYPLGLRRILAPTDLNPDGRKAVDYAVALAEHFNSQLTILHVYPAPHFNDYPRPTDGYNVADIFRQNAQDALDSFRSEIRQEYRIDTLLRCGKPEEQIVEVAKDLEIDLIVLSTHDYHWFSHLIHGSEAEGVLRHAPCPILVVRREGHDFLEAN